MNGTAWWLPALLWCRSSWGEGAGFRASTHLAKALIWLDLGLNLGGLIIEAAHNATEQGRLIWGTDIYGLAEFNASTLRNKLTLRRVKSGPFDEWYYYFGICRIGEFEPIEEFSDLDLKDCMPKSYTTMENLYKLARWQANGLDEEINNILFDL